MSSLVGAKLKLSATIGSYLRRRSGVSLLAPSQSRPIWLRDLA